MAGVDLRTVAELSGAQDDPNDDAIRAPRPGSQAGRCGTVSIATDTKTDTSAAGQAAESAIGVH